MVSAIMNSLTGSKQTGVAGMQKSIVFGLQGTRKGFIVTSSGRKFLFKTKREALAFMADHKDGLPL